LRGIPDKQQQLSRYLPKALDTPNKEELFTASPISSEPAPMTQIGMICVRLRT